MFLLIALLCTASVEVPDSLDGVYIADSTLLLESLTISEITKLETARLKEFQHVCRAYRHYEWDTWAAQMTLWFKHTYDSLEVSGKDPWSYYYVTQFQYNAAWEDYLRHRISVDDLWVLFGQLPMVSHNHSLGFINPDY